MQFIFTFTDKWNFSSIFNPSLSPYEPGAVERLLPGKMVVSALSLFLNKWIAFCLFDWWIINGLLVRYVNVQVARAPEMPGTFSLSPRVSDTDMHRGTCVTQVPWCMSELLTSDFLWSWWRRKRSRHSRRMRNPQFYVSGKMSIPTLLRSA